MNSSDSRDTTCVVLSFQRLDVYKCSIEMLELCVHVLNSIPRGHHKLVDQLKRSSRSVVLNIAEGYGKITRKDKANFYAIARGSAMETAAVFDVLKVNELVDPEQYRQAMILSDRIIAMLSKMTAK